MHRLLLLPLARGVEFDARARQHAHDPPLDLVIDLGDLVLVLLQPDHTLDCGDVVLAEGVADLLAKLLEEVPQDNKKLRTAIDQAAED